MSMETFEQSRLEIRVFFTKIIPFLTHNVLSYTGDWCAYRRGADTARIKYIMLYSAIHNVHRVIGGHKVFDKITDWTDFSNFPRHPERLSRLSDSEFDFFSTSYFVYFFP